MTVLGGRNTGAYYILLCCITCLSLFQGDVNVGKRWTPGRVSANDCHCANIIFSLRNCLFSSNVEWWSFLKKKKKSGFGFYTHLTFLENSVSNCFFIEKNKIAKPQCTKDFYKNQSYPWSKMRHRLSFLLEVMVMTYWDTPHNTVILLLYPFENIFP